MGDAGDRVADCLGKKKKTDGRMGGWVDVVPAQLRLNGFRCDYRWGGREGGTSYYRVPTL